MVLVLDDAAWTQVSYARASRMAHSCRPFNAYTGPHATQRLGKVPSSGLAKRSCRKAWWVAALKPNYAHRIGARPEQQRFWPDTLASTLRMCPQLTPNDEANQQLAGAWRHLVCPC